MDESLSFLPDLLEKQVGGAFWLSQL